MPWDGQTGLAECRARLGAANAYGASSQDGACQSLVRAANAYGAGYGWLVPVNHRVRPSGAAQGHQLEQVRGVLQEVQSAPGGMCAQHIC